MKATRQAGPAQTADAAPRPMPLVADGQGMPVMPAVPTVPAVAASNGPAPGPAADLNAQMNQMVRAANQPAMPGSAQAVNESEILAAMGKVDWGSIQTSNFRLIPTDVEVESIIEKVTPQRSKSSGNPMIALELKTTFPIEYAGVKLFDQCVLTEKSYWKFKSLLEACDQCDESGRFIGQSLQELKEYVVRHMVMHDTYQGQTRNKIAGGYSAAYQTPGLQAPAVAGPAGADWVTPPTG